MLPRGPFVLRTGSCMIRTVAEGMGLHTRWNETDGEAADFTERTASPSKHSPKLMGMPPSSIVSAGEKRLLQAISCKTAPLQGQRHIWAGIFWRTALPTHRFAYPAGRMFP